jgi:hypothetical protein
MFLDTYYHASRDFVSSPVQPLRSSLFPLPWYTWQLELPEPAKIITVDDARDWVRLLSRFPRVHEGQVCADWAGIAAHYDGVRLTLPAVVAIQGVRFVTSRGPTAPSFWDVESTFWLRWRFTGAKLVDKTV